MSCGPRSRRPLSQGLESALRLVPPLPLSNPDQPQAIVRVNHHMEDVAMAQQWTSGSWAVCLLALCLMWYPYADSEPEHVHPTGSKPHSHSKAPIKITMEELHRLGGVPPGWEFHFP